MADPSTPPVPPVKRDPGPFGKTNTDLGKFSHGNFDVQYTPTAGELVTTFRAKYEFEPGIPSDEMVQFKLAMGKAVGIWDHSGIYLATKSRDALNKTIALRFRLIESNDYNKIVDVAKDHMRPYVFRDLNISIDYRYKIKTLAHELGHVFGNYDEYRGSGFLAWIERRMWWHDNDYLDDTDSMMNGGLQFRKRYFDHFQEYVNENFKKFGIRYELQQGPQGQVHAAIVDSKWAKSGVNFAYVPNRGGPRKVPGSIRSLRRELIQLYVRK